MTVHSDGANIKFCFKIGETATEMFQLIKQAYGDNALTCAWVFRMVRKNLGQLGKS